VAKHFGRKAAVPTWVGIGLVALGIVVGPCNC
jgi:hypothetical protein